MRSNRLYVVEVDIGPDGYPPGHPGYMEECWVVLEDVVEHSSLRIEQRPCVYLDVRQARERVASTDHRARIRVVADGVLWTQREKS